MSSTANEQQAAALIGRKLGDFVLREQLGRGGFGYIFRAEQTFLQRETVVKVLAAGGDQPASAQQFLREARIASRLEHPYAAHIYAFGAEDDGLLWIAMELVRGTTLGALVAQGGPLAVERFAPLLNRICEVVDAAHARGIVHRDIKPKNIMVVERGGELFPKLLDFGLATVRDRSSMPVQRARGKGRRPQSVSDSLFALADTIAGDGGSLLVGTPHYMSPEQWQDGAARDPRVDVYALGVVTYQALTGRVPFDGEDTLSIAEAHLCAEVPSLGSQFPGALDAFMARALAKSPEERFGSALELARAFEQAAGLNEPAPDLPQIPPSAQATALAVAAQPVAEAVAMFEGATSEARAWEAVDSILRAVCHYVGVIALAGEQVLGGRLVQGLPRARELIAALREGRLDAAGWLELAGELCRPMAASRTAAPLPELVGLFFDEAGEPSTPFRDAAGDLAALAAARAPDTLASAAARIGDVIAALEPVFAYPLVVRRGDRLEKWTGIRRPVRSTMARRYAELPEGRPALATPRGNIALLLWPLAQVLEPAPGSPLELFLLEGGGRFGARLQAIPRGFERSDDAMWSFLRPILGDAAANEVEVAGDGRAPFLGLSAFSADDAGRYFGREREVESFVNRLRIQPLIAIVGPSGAGKSSFVHAGVVPMLPQSARTVTVRPGRAPLAALAEALAGAGADPDTVRAMADEPAALSRALTEIRGDRGSALLVVDQFEEILTLCERPEQRRRYAEVLAHAAAAGDERIRIVITLRDDFLMRAQDLAPLKRFFDTSLYLLGVPAPTNLERILTEPLRRTGYAFEDEALIQEIVRAVAQKSGALALLSFTASRLWEARDRDRRLLTRRAYDRLGGVGGALARHAEETLAAMPPDQRALVRELFRHLVTAEGTRAVISRAELRELVGDGAEAVVERLLSARLLVGVEGDEDDDRVEIIHEALLSMWPRLVRWRQEDADSARMRDQVRSAARQWDGRRRPDGLLWRGELLVEFELLHSRGGIALTDVERAFVSASRALEARGRRRRRWLSALTTAVLSVGLVLVGMTSHRARRNAHRAEESARSAQRRLVRLYAEKGRTDVLAGRRLRAAVYLAKAYQDEARMHMRTAATRFLLGRALHPLDAQVAVLRGHKRAVQAAVFTPDGSRVVTGSHDGTARIWDWRTGKVLATLPHRGEVRHVAMFPGGHRILTGTFNSSDKPGIARIWDLDTHALLHVLTGHRGGITALAISPDGRHVATASFDGTARLWNAGSGRLQASFPGGGGYVSDVAFSPDGRALAMGSESGSAQLRAVATGRVIARLGGSGSAVTRVVFLGNRRVITGHADGTARIWDARSGALLHLLEGHTERVRDVAVSPDRSLIATASDDQTVRLWHAGTGKLALVLSGHRGAVNRVAFSPDGRRIATTSSDLTARLWDVATGQQLSVFEGHTEAVFAVAFQPDGGTLLTSSFDGTARLWDTTRSERRRTFHAHDGAVWSAEFDPSGKRVVTAGNDGAVRVWNWKTGEQELDIKAHDGAAYQATFSPDGNRIVSAGNDGLVKIWSRSGQLVRVLDASAGPAYRARFSPDGTRVVSAGEDGVVRVWDAHTGRLLRRLRGHSSAVWGIRFDPSGRVLVTASDDRTVRRWNLATGALLGSITRFGGAVNSAAFGPSGNWLVAGGVDQDVTLWRPSTGRLIASLQGHTAQVNTVSVSGDGHRILTASTDGTVRIWDADDDRVLDILPTRGGVPYYAAFAPDGETIAVARDDGRVDIWQLPLEKRSPAEVRKLVSCRVPYRLQGERLLPNRHMCAP